MGGGGGGGGGGVYDVCKLHLDSDQITLEADLTDINHALNQVHPFPTP